MAKKSETKKTAQAQPIRDVAHPGQSAPAANSRSVIVSNRPIMKDPMVVDDDAEEPVPAKLPLSRTERKLEPEQQPQAPTPPKTEDPAETPANDEPDDPKTGPDKPETTEPEPETEPEAAKTKTKAAEETGSEADDEDAPAAKDNKAIEAAAAEHAKRQAAIDKLADNKQYYLPINTVEKRRSRRFVALGVALSLLLILAWADIALDAGLIQISGIKPVTHFFSN